MVNKVNIQKVIDRLSADTGKHFEMKNWSTNLVTGDSAKAPECNTAYCVAGWMNAIDFAEHPDQYKFRPYYGIISDSRNAGMLMGLEPADWDDLFMLRHECVALFEEMADFDRYPDEQKREAGIKVLEILRDTGKVNWPVALNFADIEYLNYADEY